MTNDARELSETHSYTDFATAGQDAFALVAFLVHLWGECKLKTANFQMSVFPVPKSMIHIADAAAIKVCPLCLSGCMPSTVTLVRRRSQPIMPGFLNPYICMR
jgi:hypothetical protein